MSANATPEDVLRLAALARIEVPDADLAAFAAEFDAILAYVGKLDELSIDTAAAPLPLVRNSFREDGTPYAAGTWTDALALQFPERDGDYLAVKQIITHD